VDTSVIWGSLCFGAVIGWITYYTMRKNTKPRTLSDLTVIIAALVGPGILTVFPAPVAGTRQTMFGYYGIGLASGFFLYYILFLLLVWAAPARVLLSMGLAQPGEIEPGTPSGDGETPMVRPDTGIMGEHSEEPFIEMR
jgi:hypothetical protein